MNRPADVAIEARRASVSLGGREVWRDLDLEVRAGEFVAVLGPNGAGKSTLVKAVLGLVPLGAGELRVDDTVSGEGRHQVTVRWHLPVSPERTPEAAVTRSGSSTR